MSRRRGIAVLVLAAVLVSLSLSVAYAQQEPSAQANEEASAETETSEETEAISFAADSFHYDDESKIATASGNIQLNQAGVRMRADRIVWNRSSGEITAEGNVVIRNPAGDSLYSDRAVLSDSLHSGAVDNLLLVLETGGRLAADKASWRRGENVRLDNALYTPCPIDDGSGCARSPAWRIRAVEVYYDRDKKRIRYKKARIEVFGGLSIPLLGVSGHPATSERASGLLFPRLRINRVNGFEIALPYFLRLSDNKDLTLTPHIYSGGVPLLESEFRATTKAGAYRLHGYGTYSSRVPLAGEDRSERQSLRGYVETSGKFYLNRDWNLQFAGRVTSDRTFLRRYDITRDDRLRSMIGVERVGDRSYFSIEGWTTQTLRVDDSQGLQPIALPLIDYRLNMRDPLLGGRIQLQANSLALTRSAGQDTQRAFANMTWNLRRLTPWGQEVQLTALVRGDVYHNSDPLDEIAEYRGTAGWHGRGIAAFAADVRWPFIGHLGSSTQRLVPRVQIVATPRLRNISIANEDSRSFDLDEYNIFDLNRFSGYDRFEDGVRVTYGLEWNITRPGLAITNSIAQSYRLSRKPSLFIDGTGLSDRVSDIVGSTHIAWGNMLRLHHRFRLDKDRFQIRRSEVDVTIGSRRSYATVGYLLLNRNSRQPIEDIADREVLRFSGRIGFAKYWALFGSAIVDLTDSTEDPTSNADGFEPIRHRLGIVYKEKTITLGLTWQRDYQDTGDARRGNSFFLHIALHGLGD